MGYLSLYKTLADYNKDASNRQNPHVSLITDDKKLILINASNVSKEISNVKIIESLTPDADHLDYNDFPTDTHTMMPVGIKIYTDNSQKSKETNKQLFDNYIYWLNNTCNIYSGIHSMSLSFVMVDDLIYNVITHMQMGINTGELKVGEFYTILSDGSIVVHKNITGKTTPPPMAITLKCDACGYTYSPDGDNNVCPKCGGQGIEIETTTTSEPTTTPTTTSPGGIYNTEMPIYVKMIDADGNEVPNTIPVTFCIDCNGTSKDFTLTNSGTISGYHYLDNNIIESFFMVCKDSEMYYKENGYYYTMPKITSFGQFMDYHQKGGAIYIIVDYLLSSTTPAPDEKYTTLKCTKCGYEYPSNGNDNEVCPKCGGDGFEQTTLPPTDSTTPTSSPTTSPNPNK